MDKHAFEELSEEEKALLIRSYAVFIDSIHHYGGWINLYSLGHFFIEAFFVEDEIEIVHIDIADESALDKYLYMITLPLPF